MIAENRLFGSDKIEIRPQGSVDMTLGANLQRTENPNIPIRNRNTGGFDFDMHINMNVIGKIGDKLQLGLKYNTQSGFQFDNTVKLGYTGGQDDIIKSIEAGNVSFALPTRLITGSQSLFGMKHPNAIWPLNLDGCGIAAAITGPNVLN